MHKTKIALAAVLVVGVTTPALAIIDGWFGAALKIAPPASVAVNMSQSNVSLQAFDERQCFPVPGGGILTDQGPIPPGTLVSSHMVHADPTPGNALLLTGRVHFNHDILGVISTTALLDGSDVVCGNPGTIYPTGVEPNRGFEAPPQLDDYAVLAPRMLRVRMDVPVNSYSDQIRVITRCCPQGQNCD